MLIKSKQLLRLIFGRPIAQRRPLTARDGFTLMELIITIAVAGVLALISFMAVKRVSEGAASTKCMTNMRAVSQLIFQYAHDHNNDLLPHLTLGHQPNTGSHWLYWLWAERYLVKEAYVGLKHGVMTCPSRDEPAGYEPPTFHFGMNSYPGWDNMIVLGEPFYKLLKVERPSQTVLLADSNADYALIPERLETLAYPHNGFGNSIFMDGHAERLAGPWKAPTAGDSYPWY